MDRFSYKFVTSLNRTRKGRHPVEDALFMTKICYHGVNEIIGLQNTQKQMRFRVG
jgi:hypothetical protein